MVRRRKVRRVSPLMREAQSQAVERCRMMGSRCECEYTTHDHGYRDCDRTIKARPYVHWKPEHYRIPDANSLMVVCFTCHSQIRPSHRRIYE